MTEPKIVVVDGESYEVVEEDRSRSTLVLSVVLALLWLLLMTMGYFVYRLGLPVASVGDLGAAKGLTWVRSIYGYGPSTAEQLLLPRDCVFASNGTLWISDGQHSRLLAFRPDGTFLQSVDFKRGDGEGQIQNLQGVGIGPAGDLYVCDQGGSKVLQLESDGTFVREWPVPGAADVAANEDRVAVTSANGYALFTLDGELLSVVGTSRGSAPDQMDLPRGVAIAADGTTYVADTANKRVKAYSSDGKVLWISDGKHNDPGAQSPDESDDASTSATQGPEHEFSLPIGIELDANGRLVVTDAFDFSIWVLDPEREGAYVAHYGEFGQDDGSLIYPSGLAYDAQRDWFAVADTNMNRAQIVRLPGSGDSLAAKVRRLFVGPVWMCAIPLLLLLLALVVAMLSRRRARARTRDELAEVDDMDVGVN